MQNLKAKHSEVGTNTRRLMINQLIIGLIIAGFFSIKVDNNSAISAIYGMLITMSTTALLSYGVQRAEKAATDDPKVSMGILYFGAVQRFIMVAALFIIGLGLLKLEPLPMAAAFGLTQFAYVFNFSGLRKNSL